MDLSVNILIKIVCKIQELLVSWLCPRAERDMTKISVTKYKRSKECVNSCPYMEADINAYNANDSA